MFLQRQQLARGPAAEQGHGFGGYPLGEGRLRHVVEGGGVDVERERDWVARA
jgi:hypothetical protein